MKVALVYDRVNKWGGAERVLLALHKLFPDAPLFTSVYNPETAPWASVFTIYTSFLQHIPFARSHHEFFAGLMPFAFENFNFDSYDLVISITSEAAKGIITQSHTKHICLCLTPTRYLWSGYDEYFSNPLIRLATKPLIEYLRSWDYIAAQRPDSYIAISKEVAKRIKKYYAREVSVIYPPITINKSLLVSGQTLQRKQNMKKDYFLVVSRLSRFTSYKRVDLAIKAANKLKVPLVVVGDGDIARFKEIAGPTITFTGRITDEELASYYANCKALIFPGNEDFGLTMVEAQSFSKPVVAYGKGGAREIVIEGKTGTFFNFQTVTALVDALKSFDETEYNSEDCIKNAQRFSFILFEKQLQSFIQHNLAIE